MHLFRIGLQRQFRRSCIFASTESELKSSLDKAPRLSNDIWSLSSDTICQLNQLFSNSEAAMRVPLSSSELLLTKVTPAMGRELQTLDSREAMRLKADKADEEDLQMLLQND